jgi:hypothetical protein
MKLRLVLASLLFAAVAASAQVPPSLPSNASGASSSASAPSSIASVASQPVLQPSSSVWEPKDTALLVGTGVTFLLGVFTLCLGIWNANENRRNALANQRLGERTTFVNIVTSQRIKWIEQLRQDIGAFSGIVYHWSHSEMAGKAGEGDLLKEMDRLRHVIRLRLNPLGEHDKTIEKLIEEIPHYTDPQRQTELVDALERLTKATQALLKEEWDKVKRESGHGALSDRA